MDRQHTSAPVGRVPAEPAHIRNETEAHAQVEIIEKTLGELGIAAEVRNIHYGPRLTQFTLKTGHPGEVANIIKAEADLAVALSGSLAQIEEPDPRYPYLRIIVENHGRPDVRLRRILESPTFQHAPGAIKIGLGLDTFGGAVVIDLAGLPHLLIGGTTGSGKSVCINATIASLLSVYRPEEVRLLLIDPLRVELEKYEGLPHLATPVVSRTRDVPDILNQVIEEIERRYITFSQAGVRDIAAYNRQAARKLAYLIIIIDNLLDLLQVASKDIEQALTRIAQKARGAGVHLILATVRANTGTVSGTIKANFPGRIAFRVTDRAESQQILDAGGAEKLLGQGDMLYKSPQTNFIQRVQGMYVTEEELQRITHFWRQR